MIDHGASITDTQLQIAKDSALVILNAIDEHDKVCERGRFSSLSGICIYISYHSWFDGPFCSFPDLHTFGGRDRSLLLSRPVLQKSAVSSHQRDEKEDEHLCVERQGV